MSDEIETGDGCDLPQEEALRLFSLHPDSPANGSGPVVSDRGLILVALSQEEADETARILKSKFEEALARNPLLRQP